MPDTNDGDTGEKVEILFALAVPEFRALTTHKNNGVTGVGSHDILAVKREDGFGEVWFVQVCNHIGGILSSDCVQCPRRDPHPLLPLPDSPRSEAGRGETDTALCVQCWLFLLP